MYEVSEGFMTFLSVTATLSTIGLFLCGIQICSRIRQRGTTEGTAVAPFLVTSISCICWLAYGVLKEDSTVMLVNSVGLLVQSAYLVYYYSKTRLRSRLNKLITLELTVGLCTILFVRSDSESRETVLGIICMFLNIASIGSPLLDVGQVIKTKSTESVPFMLCAGNMVVSVQWLLYGFLVDDFYMKVPNTIAVFISAIQLSLFILYPERQREYGALWTSVGFFGSFTILTVLEDQIQNLKYGKNPITIRQIQALI